MESVIDFFAIQKQIVIGKKDEILIEVVGILYNIIIKRINNDEEVQV